MTIRAAAGIVAGQAASKPRLALPGAVLLLAGGALLWWGTGVFRGEVRGGGFSGPPKQMFNPGESGKIQPTDDDSRGGSGLAWKM